MRTSRDQQSLSYPLRLPDEAQVDALRLLDVSREVINAVVAALWPRLDEFGMRETRYAYKQVEEMINSPQPHGHRQWRCEAEQAGRILRGQAERKKQFALILPILSAGMILPATEKKQAGKNRKAIGEALADLRDANADGGNAVELQSLIEQACNFYNCPMQAMTDPPLVNPIACPLTSSTRSSRLPSAFLMSKGLGHVSGEKRP